MEEWADLRKYYIAELESACRQKPFFSKVKLVETEEKVYYSINSKDPDEVFQLVEDLFDDAFGNFDVVVTSTVRGSVKDREYFVNNCTFKSGIYLINTEFTKPVLFSHCNFESKPSFSRVMFKEKVRFYSCKFLKGASFDNTKFKDLVDFYLSEFYAPQQFLQTDFLGITIFSNVCFREQVQFLYCKVSSNSVISFENADLYQSLDISRANFWCKVHYWNLAIDMPLPEHQWLYQTDDTTFSKDGNRMVGLQCLRESYRIIKNEFQKVGDNISSLKYHKYEMELYRIELKVDNLSNKEERVRMFFNKWSNDFGVSWVRGIVFTMVAAIIFFIPYFATYKSDLILDISCSGVINVLKYYFEFLNITKWDIRPFGLLGDNGSYLLLFIGRIFISYGYFQTIQAFRRFGFK